MKLTNPSEVSRLMEKYGISFQKKYGQNFLIDDHIPRMIAEQCGAESNEAIIEIGPGIGTLTVELAKIYKTVICIEIDKSLIPVLNDTLSNLDNVIIINDDFLNIDIKDLSIRYFPDSNFSICANLPYYITTPIIMHILDSEILPNNITVMIQKEVAQRLLSLPGTSDYGSITASVNLLANVYKLFNVSSNCFMPAPKVDSAVIKIVPKKNISLSKNLINTVKRVIRGSFLKRRKTLVNSLISEFSEFNKNELQNILLECGILPNIRGEKLNNDDFINIALKISKNI